MRFFSEKTRDLSYISIANITELSLNAIFWFVLLTSVSKTEFGEIAYVLSTVMFVFGLSRFGLNKLIIVYGAKEQPVYGPAYLLGLIFSGTAAIIVFLVTQNPFISILVVGMMMFELMISTFVSKSQFFKSSSFLIIRRIISVVIGISLYFVLGVNGILLGYFLGSLLGIIGIKNLFSTNFSIRSLKPKSRFLLSTYTVGLFVTLIEFGIPITIGTIFSYELLAGYQISYQFLLVLIGIPVILTTYLLPKESTGQSNRSLKFYSILITVILVIIAVFSIPFAIENFLPQYGDSILAMQIMSLAVLPLLISTIIETTFLGNEKTKFILISGAVQVITVFPLILILGQMLETTGFVIAVLISFVAKTLSNFILYQFFFKKSNLGN